MLLRNEISRVGNRPSSRIPRMRPDGPFAWTDVSDCLAIEAHLSALRQPTVWPVCCPWV